MSRYCIRALRVVTSICVLTALVASAALASGAGSASTGASIHRAAEAGADLRPTGFSSALTAKPKKCKAGKKGKRCRVLKRKRAAAKRAAVRRAAARRAAAAKAAAAKAAADRRSKLLAPGAGAPLPVAHLNNSASGMAAYVLGSTAETLAELRKRSSSADPRYYDAQDRAWVDGSGECVRCTLGPAVLSATVAAATGDRTALVQARDSFDQVIKANQRADGAIVPEAPGEGGPGIQTVFFGTQLATSYILLEDSLDSATKAAWKQSLSRASRYLARSGTLSWYTNGNINLALSMLMDMTWRITGEVEFQRAAAASIEFTIAPTGRFQDFGLKYVKLPTRVDGSDGAAYLAESGGAEPGYDPAYSLMQSNLASQWFLMTGNPVARRLTNLLTNNMMSRVRQSDWTIDVSGGTRRAAAGVRYPFVTSAISVLVTWGGRTDLAPLMNSQVTAMLNSYRGATSYTHPGMSFGYGLEMATSLEALLFTPSPNGLKASVVRR